MRLKEEFQTNTTNWLVRGKCSCKNLATWKYYDNSFEFEVLFFNLSLWLSSVKALLEPYFTSPELDASRWVISFNLYLRSFP